MQKPQSSRRHRHDRRVTRVQRIKPLLITLLTALVAYVAWPAQLVEAQSRNARGRAASARTVYYGNQRYPSRHHFYGRNDEVDAREVRNADRALASERAKERVLRQDLAVRDEELAIRNQQLHRARARDWNGWGDAWGDGCYDNWNDDWSDSFEDDCIASPYGPGRYAAYNCGPYGCYPTFGFPPIYGLYGPYGYGYTGYGYGGGYEYEYDRRRGKKHHGKKHHGKKHHGKKHHAGRGHKRPSGHGKRAPAPVSAAAGHTGRRGGG